MGAHDDFLVKCAPSRWNGGCSGRVIVRKLIAIALSVGALGACSSAPAPGPQAEAFDRSAATAGVPRDLLVAIAEVEGGLAMPAWRDVRPDADLPAAGPMMLRRGQLDTLARGAALAKASELSLRQDTDLALSAGALVLAELGARTGAREGDLSSWQDALEELSGYQDAAHREEYAHRVFATLARGGALEGRDGERLALPAHAELPPALTFDLRSTLHVLGADYPGAEWIPTSCTNKCDTSRGGNKVGSVVVHDTEGGWDASVATLQNDSGKSVHYIVGTDGRVAQFVPETYTAWHAGNYYYNQRSVGIEHVGYWTKPFTEAEYTASAKLVSYLLKKYGIAADRAHVIGHDQIPDGGVIAQSSPPCSDAPSVCEKGGKYGGSSNHTDPGIWEWATYMPRVGGDAKCNDVTDLWNCGWDAKRAYRCAGGKVEVKWCNGPKACQTMATGKDDVCDQASDEPPLNAFDPTPKPAPTGPSGPGVTPPTDTPKGGGCSAAPRADGAAWAIALGLALLARRRRR